MLDSLPKIFYSNKKLHTTTYLERFSSPFSVHLPCMIKQFGRNKSFQAFFSYNQDIALLLENILSLFATFTDILHDIPPVVMRQFYLACLVDEVRSTSSIEGIHSTRRELHDVLEGNTKNHFSSIVKKYDLLISGNPPLFTTCEDVRAFYDEFAHDDVSATNPRNKLDGVLFRKEAVDVLSPSGKIIHRGIEPEQDIIQAMSDALNFLNDNSLPALIRIAAFHYLFAYIHPFYDGNGRTARFISSSYIARRLHPLIALRLAVTIKRRIKRYYSLLRDTDAEINCGDLTPFICGFLEFIADTINDVNKKLSRKVKQLERFRIWLPKNFHDYGVMDLLLQASTFYGRGLAMNEIISLSGKSRNTIKKLFCSLPVRTKTSINSRKKFYKINWVALKHSDTISIITP